MRTRSWVQPRAVKSGFCKEKEAEKGRAGRLGGDGRGKEEEDSLHNRRIMQPPIQLGRDIEIVHLARCTS